MTVVVVFLHLVIVVSVMYDTDCQRSCTPRYCQAVRQR